MISYNFTDAELKSKCIAFSVEDKEGALCNALTVLKVKFNKYYFSVAVGFGLSNSIIHRA